MQSPAAVAVLRKISDRIGKLRRRDDGQDLLEYGLLAALVAVVALGAVQTVGNTINTVFWKVIATNF